MSLKGRTFMFNGNITRYPDSGKGFLVVREVNNVKEYFFTDSEGNKYKEFEEAEKLYYVGEYPPASSDATITVWQNDTWLNDKYKTITFIEEPTGFTQNGMPYTRTEEEFEQFLLYNCTEVISEIETITDFDGKVHHLRDETVPSLMAAKADKVSSATNGNFAALDSNGNLIDSGHKHSDYLTQHQDISGKVNGPSSAVNNQVAVFDGTTGKAIKDSGFTIGKSVPSDAVFTDTNTWRPIEGTTASPSVDAAFSSIAGNALNNNLSLLQILVAHSTGLQSATISLRGFTGTLRNNGIGYSYNDKYLVLTGVARYREIQRTGSNPGIYITLPVAVKTFDLPGVARIPTGGINEFANFRTENSTTLTVFVSESTKNYDLSTLTVEIPYVVLERA